MTSASKLLHRTVYEDLARIAVKLPLHESLRVHNEQCDFTLLEDPRLTNRTLFLGMFVLRPAVGTAFSKSLLNDDMTPNDDVYSDSHDWAFNVKVSSFKAVQIDRLFPYYTTVGVRWWLVNRQRERCRCVSIGFAVWIVGCYHDW
jgi:hypothetical protein